MISRRLFVLCALFAVSAAYVRRQVQELNENGEISMVGGWDPTLRDHTAECKDFAGDFEEDKYCNVFQKCCSMTFDPINGDKCQEKTEVCDSRENAVCIHRNCTEKITTTTTTTLAPSTQNTNAAGLFTLPLAVLSLYILQ